MRSARFSSLVRAVLVCGALAAAIVAVDAAPAAAHGMGSVQSTNVQSRIDSVAPEIPGVDVRVIELGKRVELSNSSDTVVTVLGYDGEPYLRIGPDGVEENERSPAVFINRTSKPPEAVPERYDASATPKWRHVSDSTTARWHDHRSHYMGSGDPPVASKSKEAVFSRWTIDLLADGNPVEVRGELTWVPPPSPWPWIALAVGLALALVFAARRWWTPAVATALVLLLASEFAHVISGWDARVGSLLSHLGSDAYSLLAIVLALIALERLRRGPFVAAPWVLVTGILFVVAGGITDLDVLYHSQTPGSLTGGWARALVAIAFGGGAACIVAGARRLRPPVDADSGSPEVTPAPA